MTTHYSSLSAGFRRHRFVILAGSVAALLGSHAARAVTHTITPGATSWNTPGNWTNGVPNAAGDIATLAGAVTSTSLDTGGVITIGQLTNTGAALWTLTSGTTTGFTFDNTGGVINLFGNSNAAISTSGAGGLTIGAVPISIGATNLDIGSTSTGNITIGGAITASATSILNFRANSSGTISDSAAIGASGSGITINNAGTGSGSTTLSGNLGPSVTSVTQASAGSLVLSGTDSYTGLTAVNSGTLTLSGTLNGSTGTALSFGGGTLAYTKAASTQNFTGTAIATGQNAITTVTGSTVNLGAITHTIGGTVDFTSAGTGVISTTTANTATSILGGYATVGGNTWAVSAGNGSTAGAITGLAAGSYTTSVAGTTTPASTADVDFQLSNTNGWSGTINSLRFNTNVVTASNTLTIGTGSTLVIGSGGILSTSAINTSTNSPVITGGTITGGNGELDLITNNGGSGSTVTINSIIADNGGTPLTLVKSGGTTLNLNGAKTYTGNTYINNGLVNLGNSGNFGAAAAGIYGTVFLGSPSSGNGVSINNDGDTIANPVNVASGPGTRVFQKVNNNGTALFSGLITLNGGGGTNGLQLQNDNVSTFLNFTGGFTGTGNITTTSFNGRNSGGITISGGDLNMAGTFSNITGNAQVTTISSAVGSSVTGIIENSTASELDLSGNNSAFVGGVTLTAGTLKLGSVTALGGTASTLTITAGTLDSSVANLVLANNNALIWNGDFTFAGSNSLNLGTGNVSLGSTAGARTVTANANTLTVGGIISNGTATGLTKAGGGHAAAHWHQCLHGRDERQRRHFNGGRARRQHPPDFRDFGHWRDGTDPG